MRWLQWRLDRFANDRLADRLIDHAAWLPRDGLQSVSGVDEQGRMDATGLGWVVMQRRAAPERRAGIPGLVDADARFRRPRPARQAPRPHRA